MWQQKNLDTTPSWGKLEALPPWLPCWGSRAAAGEDLCSAEAEGKAGCLVLKGGAAQHCCFSQATGWLVRNEKELPTRSLLETATWKHWQQSVMGEALGMV